MYYECAFLLLPIRREEFTNQINTNMVCLSEWTEKNRCVVPFSRNVYFQKNSEAMHRSNLFLWAGIIKSLESIWRRQFGIGLINYENYAKDNRLLQNAEEIEHNVNGLSLQWTIWWVSFQRNSIDPEIVWRK